MVGKSYMIYIWQRRGVRGSVRLAAWQAYTAALATAQANTLGLLLPRLAEQAADKESVAPHDV
eukprot:COSAG01_NODE_41957_length_445_cov_0.901734_1_plen_62_part_01